MCVLTNANATNFHSVRGRQVLRSHVCVEVMKMTVATDVQDNMSVTVVAPALCCSHFKVECVETHLTNEANFEAKTVTT